jgi:2-(1,2-epoxy-1,2-dihydrophenyl)acetyl-CoA isomerase
MNERVTLARDGAVAFIEFRRPERHNALDVATAEAFLERCREVERDNGVRAVVLAGQGASFGAGGDLAELQAGGARAARNIIAPLHEAVALLVEMDAPVIARLRGIVAGGSMSLALGCDLAVASEQARFNFAYTNVGTTADLGGSWYLPRVVGLRGAMQIALLNETIDAQRALALGLVNQVVPEEQLDSEVRGLALRLASGPTKALGRMKRLLRLSGTNGLHDQLAVEAATFIECAGTNDFREAIDAILGKRAPRFAGK